MSDLIREAFEKWYVDKWYEWRLKQVYDPVSKREMLQNIVLMRDGQKYEDGKDYLNHSWEGWQAAKQSMQNSLVGEIKGKASSGSPLVIIHDWDLPSGTKLYTHAPDDAAVIADLQAQVDALRKDAELMRWLRDNNATVYPVEEQKRGYRSTEPNAKPEVWYERIGWNVSTLPMGNVYKTMDEAIYAAISKGGE